MKNTKLKNIIILAILAVPFPICAAEGWAVMESGKMFSVQGGCLNDTVKIAIFNKVEDKNPIDSYDAKCENGEFYFSSDLFKKEISTGNYFISVDGQMNLNPVSIKNADNKQTAKKIENNEKKQESSDVKFLGAFAVFQQSILDMRTWLAETKYPSWVKTGIDGTLDGIDKLSGKISDMLFSADSPQGETADDSATLMQDSNFETINGENAEDNIDENQSSNNEMINN